MPTKTNTTWASTPERTCGGCGVLAAGGSVDFTLKHHVQEGVNSFRTTTYATARDICGNVDEYPAPLP